MISIGSVAVLGSAAGIGTEVGTGPDIGTGTKVGAGGVLLLVLEVLGWDVQTVIGLDNMLDLDAVEETDANVGEVTDETVVNVVAVRTLVELLIRVATEVLGIDVGTEVEVDGNNGESPDIVAVDIGFGTEVEASTDVFRVADSETGIGLIVGVGAKLNTLVVGKAFADINVFTGNAVEVDNDVAVGTTVGLENKEALGKAVDVGTGVEEGAETGSCSVFTVDNIMEEDSVP